MQAYTPPHSRRAERAYMRRARLPDIANALASVFFIFFAAYAALGAYVLAAYGTTANAPFIAGVLTATSAIAALAAIYFPAARPFR